MGLKTYYKKRDFSRTPEPEGKIRKSARQRFVVQEHHASRLHFDFRLEMEGVLKSWSVPKGPSLDPSEKRLAVETEDHPVDYLKFEGQIGKGNYGAGEVLLWDTGTYEMVSGSDKPEKALRTGKLSFILRGDKLRGEFNLIQMKRRDRQWLLVKGRDEFAEPGWKLETILQGTKRTKKGSVKNKTRRARKGSGSVSKAKDAQDRRPILAARFFEARKLGGGVSVKVKRSIVDLTNLDKVYWPDEGYTKGDLIRYYYGIAPHLLTYLKDRPLILKRFPDGITADFFYQHDVDQVPDYIRTSELEAKEGHYVDYVIGGSLETLLYTANLGAIEQHPWHSRIRQLEHPDWIVLDLDPGEGVRYSTVCEVALSVRDLLERMSLLCFPKTSGARGMHIYIPIRSAYGYQQVAEFAEEVAARVADESPEIATIERSLKKRKRGQVYVDHLQNARGKSIVAPYSARPKPGATVSAPLTWSEIKGKELSPQDFTIENMVKRVERKGDLFAPVLSERQGLGEAVKRIRKKGMREAGK